MRVNVVTKTVSHECGRELPYRFSLRSSCYKESVFGPKKDRRHLQLAVLWKRTSENSGKFRRDHLKGITYFAGKVIFGYF